MIVEVCGMRVECVWNACGMVCGMVWHDCVAEWCGMRAFFACGVVWND